MVLNDNNVKFSKGSIITFTDSSWNGMLVYNLKFLGTNEYDSNEPNYESATIIIDNEAAISMATCNKDTAGNRHVSRRYHYVRQGTELNEHNIGVKKDSMLLI